MRIKDSRRIPAAILAAAVAASAGVFWVDARARRQAEGGDPAARLAALQRAAAEPGAGAATWRDFGRALQAAGRHGHAAQAYRRAIALDPYASEPRIGLAVALAADGDREALFAHLGELLLTDARLALQVFSRPAIARYAEDPRYAEGLAEARSQAVD
jgi:cytochrome c-type biogenesis protein CcmH/NrfG